MFHTNSPVGSTGRNHLSHGITIILSPWYFLAWKAAGSPRAYTAEPAGAFAGRFIGILLKFECCDHQGRKIKRELLNICLASVYHPCHDTLHKEFSEVLNSLLHRLP
jgi:hypothetical protein